MFGKLSWEAVPFHEPIVMVTIAMIALGGLALFAAITYFKKWTYLWTEWLTSVDHKKIGVMYIIVAMVMLLRGFADAIMMRAQQVLSFGDNAGFLPPHHYDQVFTAHGVIMIFFVAMPLVTGFMNYVVPLQIGARDVAFPVLNNFSFWLLPPAAILLVSSFLVPGGATAAGWTLYAPLSTQMGIGMDMGIFAMHIMGASSIMGSINIVTTILNMRAPGMTLMKMPMFAWTWLIIGLLVWAPQDMLISLRASAVIHVWIDGFALLAMLPPLCWLCWYDRAASGQHSALASTSVKL